jgi:fumarate reductase flavoprotein subunit
VRRRCFLVGSVAGAAAMAGVLPAPAATTAVQTRDRRAAQKEAWDLVVVGAGTAGLPAAIFAAEAGARVLVIEKSAVIGGTLDRSTGQIAASRTVFQQAAGIEDSPDAHFADHMRINGWTSDPALTRLFVEEAPAAVNWLAVNGFTVVPGDPVTAKGHEPFLVRRYQQGKDGGRAILAALQRPFDAAVASGKVRLKLETSALELIQDAGGAVRGVLTESAAAAAAVREEHFGRRVLIATGGCAANPRLFEDLHGAPLTTEVARPTSQGQGLLLALGAGGVLRGGDKYLPLYGTLLESDNFPSPADGSFVHDTARRQPWEIHVNARGERFVREDHPNFEHREQALARQGGMRFWVVLDSRILREAPPFLRPWDAAKIGAAIDAGHPMFARSGDLATLALKAGVDPRGLARSVAAYNAALAAGTTDPFGREHRPRPIAEPPFLAVRITGWTVMSFAGIAVDGGLRVVRADGTAIPNLYAAGEALGAGATSGRAYTNGAMVTPALAFGRWLGRRALAPAATDRRA